MRKAVSRAEQAADELEGSSENVPILWALVDFELKQDVESKRKRRKMVADLNQRGPTNSEP